MKRLVVCSARAMLAIASLSGCTLDQEDSLRAALKEWLPLAETRFFTSQATCTVAVFGLRSLQPGSRVARASSINEALRLLRNGRVTWIDLPGHSPNVVSELIMSSDLGRGLGLLSNAVGPAQRCMDDALGRDFYRILTAPEAWMVYDPTGKAVILISPVDRAALFLRGNI